MKELLFQKVEDQSKRLCELADTIYDASEWGCEEYKSQAALCTYLEENGFTVTRGVGGLPTAFRAVYQSLEGGPRIGFLCEYDAIYGIGHACGHHMQGPSAVGAAAALKECLGGKQPFSLIVYGCPDEEGHAEGGKIVMVENGCFEDIDVAMIMHGGTETTTDLRTLAAVRFDAWFKPKPGEENGGESLAMDAMLLAFQGVEFMREHIRDGARIHYTYWPEEADAACCHAEFSVRSATLGYFEELKERFRAVLEGAAKMAGVDVRICMGREYKPKVPIQTLVDSFYENAKLAGAERIEGARKRVGSTDFANVMFKVPGIGIRIAFAPKGTSAHSREWLELGKAEEAYRAIQTAAKTLAAMGLDFIETPQKLSQARKDFEWERKRLLQPECIS